MQYIDIREFLQTENGWVTCTAICPVKIPQCVSNRSGYISSHVITFPCSNLRQIVFVKEGPSSVNLALRNEYTGRSISQVLKGRPTLWIRYLITLPGPYMTRPHKKSCGVCTKTRAENVILITFFRNFPTHMNKDISFIVQYIYTIYWCERMSYYK